MKFFTNFILLLTFLINLSIYAQNSSAPRKKIHVIPISVTPRDSFLESQIMKNALRTIYTSGEYEVIVGDDQNYRKLIFGLQTLRIKVDRKLDNYDLSVILREQKSGKLVKKYIGTKLKDKTILPKVEDFLSRLFLNEKPGKAPLLIIDKRKPLITYPRSNGNNINLTEDEAKIESNIKVLSQEEKQEKRIRIARSKDLPKKPRRKEKIWDDGKKAPKKRIVFLTNEQEPPPEPDEPEVAPPKKKPRVPTPVVEIKKEEPSPPDPIPKKKKKRKPIFFTVGAILDFEQTTTDDILEDVSTSIARYGLLLGADLWKFDWGGDIEFSAKAVTYLNDVIFRDLEASLPIEWGAKINYAQKLPLGFELKLGAELGQRSFANLREAFNPDGIQVGTLSTNDLFFDLSTRFDAFKKSHRVGVGFSTPFAQSLDYGSVDNFTTSGGTFEVYYDYFIGKKKNSFLRLMFEQRQLDIEELDNFNYESSVIGLNYVLNTSF